MTEQELFVSDIWQDCKWYVNPEPITVDDAAAMFKEFNTDGVEYPDMTPAEYATLWNNLCLTDTPSDVTISTQSKGDTTMTTAEFVRELYDSTSTSPDGITVDQAAEDIYNFDNDGWTLPDDITPEEYAAEWNHYCAVDLADRLNRYEWHEEFCEKLCDLAGLLAEYREATGDEWTNLVYQAAEKLGVTLD